MNLWDYLILAGIVVLAVLAVRYSIRHKNSCCGDCTQCHGHESCNRKKSE